MLRLILQEYFFEFNGKNYLQTHGTAVGTKMAVAFANVLMSADEMEIITPVKIFCDHSMITNHARDHRCDHAI